MKLQRTLYTATGALFVALMLLGFHRFVTNGQGEGGRIISPHILALVTTHGIAIACWFVLFFLQALLITVKKRRLHMTLGWASVAIGLTIAVTGSLVAIRSVQNTPPAFHFFGIPYSRFLLVMLVEIASFTAFLTAGILTRKRPRIHRNLMVLASLCLLPGATGRIPAVVHIFGSFGWSGLFAAVFTLGAVFLLLSSLITRTFDRTFAAAYAAWVVLWTAAYFLCQTPTWDTIAATILKI
ncbi:MAG: hypothetical protein V4555_21050 [Acidobacteriota bacterium]